MQIGIDLGATKIEYVLLDNNNKEVVRNRIPTPDNYDNTLLSIIKTKEAVCGPSVPQITSSDFI